MPPSIPAVPLFVKVAYISSFSAIILFKLINEFGNIIPIRNLIIDVDNIVTYFINLFAVLKVSFESCIFSLVNKLFHFSRVVPSRLSVKGRICFYTIRKYSFCSMVFSEIFSSKNTIKAIIQRFKALTIFLKSGILYIKIVLNIC